MEINTEITAPTHALSGVDIQSAKIDRPSYQCYESSFTLPDSDRSYPEGLYLHTSKPDGSGGFVPVNLWLASPMRLVGKTSDENGSSFGFLIEVKDGHGNWVKSVVRKRWLTNGGAEFLGALYDLGVSIDLDHKSKLVAWISKATHDLHYTVTSRCGWFGDAFITPGTTIGNPRIIYSPSSPVNGFVTQGGLSSWTEATRLARNNDAFSLALCYGFAGPLMKLAGIQGGGFHLFGDSSKGKSVITSFVSSIWGDASHLVKSWAASRTGLELYAHAVNETCVFLDELNNANPENVGDVVYMLGNVGDVVYMLGNGGGSVKGTRDRKLAAPLHWRTPVISNGERSVPDFLRMHKKHVNTGQIGRLVDVSCDFTHGAFNDLNGFNSLPEFIDLLMSTAEDHHGLAGIEFVKRISEQEGLGALIKGSMNDLTKHFPCETNIQFRGSRLFMLAVVAGYLASTFGIIQLTPDEILTSIKRAFVRWSKTFATNKDETTQILENIDAFVMAHGNTRFSELHPNDEDLIRDRAGWYKTTISGTKEPVRTWIFLTAGLVEASGGQGLDRILKALTDAKWIQIDGNGKASKATRVLGGVKRLYWVLIPDEFGE